METTISTAPHDTDLEMQLHTNNGIVVQSEISQRDGRAFYNGKCQDNRL